MPASAANLSPSELILTPQGAIYHLNLQPHQLADTIVTVGDPGRVAQVSQYFDSLEHQVQHREFVTHTGTIGTKRLSVISTGIGPDNIDIVLNELDALANIDLETRSFRPGKKALTIIRLGTSGALRRDIPVDSLVASSFAIGLDNLMHFYKLANNPEESFILNQLEEHLQAGNQGLKPYIAEGDISMRNLFLADFIPGITVTCPGFYGPQGRQLRAPMAYPFLMEALQDFESRNHRITNFEMETAAIYGLGRLLGHHCLSISAIVANRVDKTFSADVQRSVDAMIRRSLAIIAAL